ncbi:MAG: protease [Chthoniobacter sp.]|jgi:protease-4|nr:protease [Chthoniobacter sp.]
MTQKSFGCLGVALLIVLGLSLLLNFVFILGGSAATPGKAPHFEEAVVVEAKPGTKESEGKIALISLRGIITSAEPGSIGESAVDDLKIQLKQAGEDDKVKAVVLHIDSPGGEVTASDILYNAVRKVRDQHKKPVVVCMGSLAASGGYYVACGGSWLMANDTTLTGSIGVIMQSVNYEQLFGKVGLSMVTFKSGAFKDMLSGSRQMTDAEKEYLQNMIMATYGKFVGIVAKERKLNEAELRNGLADGRVVSGKDARDAKLINSLGDLEDAYAKAMELAKIKSATVIRYESPFRFGRLFRLLGQEGAHDKATVEVKLTEALLPKLQAGRLYYLPSFYAP